ncbi:unnamed protein product [Vitrella brassicaformis CCMP3155]|uniref:Uncharacterized protein n=1 Tax=Vitrella brassicaformis (strain CCMP3155) TaxID=1169540 RepID=A0A0G4GHA8_VITBC|nr:unnamed protein product [Vitrella brassicaformis CCMP3155]|eukprot:CEM29122.1 unnamed protein product [Vitrella brassicaformis CCMP3155]
MAATLFLLVASALLLAPPSAALPDVTAAPDVADSSSPDLFGALGEQVETFLNRMEEKIGSISPLVIDDGKKPREKIMAALEHIEAVRAKANATSAPNEADRPRKPMAEGELTDIVNLVEELIAEIERFLKDAEGDISSVLFSLLGSLEHFLNNLLALLPL